MIPMMEAIGRVLLLAGGGLILGAWVTRRHLALDPSAWSRRQARVTIAGLAAVVLGAGLAATGARDPILLTIPLALPATYASLRATPGSWGHGVWTILIPATYVVRPAAQHWVQDASWLVFGTAHASLGVAWLGVLALGLAARDRAVFGRAFAATAPFLVGGAAITGVFALVRANPFNAGATSQAMFFAKIGFAGAALGFAVLNARFAKAGRLPWPPLAAEVALVIAAVAASSALAFMRAL